MEFNTLVNLLDTHNEANIIATERFKPKEVIFIYKQVKDQQLQLESLKKYYNSKFSNSTFISEPIEKFDVESIKSVLDKYKDKSLLINVTKGERIYSLALLYLSQKYNIRCIYLDVENKKLISFSNEGIDITDESFYDLNIQEIIESSGGSIIVDSNESNSKAIIDQIIDLISNNLDRWERLKYRLYDPKVFIHNQLDPMTIKLDMKYLTREEMHIYNSMLSLLKKNNQIQYTSEKQDYITIKFLNNQIKSFIFKSGSWLEAYTKRVVDNIRQVDDVKSGLLFLWDSEKNRVKNELDVVAIKNSTLICISCKDTGKYDEIALNELNVYAQQLGGENVVKILVATKAPLKHPVQERAKEMNIELVIYDGNKKVFEDKLRKIILR
ncbi:Card1-like endonuclease domain-containing protein [Clostridium folliculivorans]|uniref:Card1 endonuclease domain-containing protein n=1 Tax=Clostridium folliculivorans TaxID=2886038 RepID=A0A9W5Y6C9_9CLOT|nr:DUF1887 family CARF protein [Clostridium folliculivorans]GKU27323.1 hypothetical protein CFOLD11_41500 [Clostridium folliculivorans]GKU32174.1 hypothetical protein CFB3_42820 [Clostridium folliculivorans]